MKFLPMRMVDTCGTGGDDAGTFNISDSPRQCGVGRREPGVAKHGNRAASSKAGARMFWKRWEHQSICLLPRLDREFARSESDFCLRRRPTLLRSMRCQRARSWRSNGIQLRLGPLTNPAHAQSQVLGVFSAEVLDVVAETLLELGTEHAVCSAWSRQTG